MRRQPVIRSRMRGWSSGRFLPLFGGAAGRERGRFLLRAARVVVCVGLRVGRSLPRFSSACCSRCAACRLVFRRSAGWRRCGGRRFSRIFSASCSARGEPRPAYLLVKGSPPFRPAGARSDGRPGSQVRLFGCNACRRTGAARRAAPPHLECFFLLECYIPSL